jgi:hypothetical protein
MVLEEMVAPHVPLRVVISSKLERERLKDRDLYQNLETSVALGAHGQGELDELRRRFDGLKGRFYAVNPRSTLKECRKSGETQSKVSAEEQGRRMQELAMQGRMDELRAATEAFMAAQQGMAGVAQDRWDVEVMCLEKLEAESYPVEIEVTATRDDVAG